MNQSGTLTLPMVKTALQGNDREVIAELLNLPGILPGPMRAMAYMGLMGLSNNQVKELCDKALLIIPYLENNDFDGLKERALSMGLPEPLINALVTNAANLIKHG